MEETNWLVAMFTTTYGDRTEGARYMAKNQITQEQIDALREDQIIEAHNAYMQEHADYGIDFTEDLEEFRGHLMHNLMVAAGMSRFLK